MEINNLFNARNESSLSRNYKYDDYSLEDAKYQISYQDRKSGFSYYATYILNRIRSNRKLKLLLTIVSIIALGLIALILFLLFPLLVKAYDYIAQNGINGILESIKGIVEKIMSGTGK